MRFGDRPNDREAQARAGWPSDLRPPPYERFERTGEEVWWIAWPAVGDHESGEAIEAPGTDTYDAPVWRVSNGVLEKIS